jgi:hypothetical protein
MAPRFGDSALIRYGCEAWLFIKSVRWLLQAYMLGRVVRFVRDCRQTHSQAGAHRRRPLRLMEIATEILSQTRSGSAMNRRAGNTDALLERDMAFFISRRALLARVSASVMMVSAANFSPKGLAPVTVFKA